MPLFTFRLLAFTLLLYAFSGFINNTNLRAQVVINEVMASNTSAVADEMGEFDDWVELYNNAAFAITLNGYYLSDDSLILNKWPFPNVSISGRDYLIIWTDKDPEQGPLHTTFKLDAAGEVVLLVNPLLSIIDGVAYNTQATDTTLGRFPNGTGPFVLMLPTFNGPNEAGLFTGIATEETPLKIHIYPNPATDAALIQLPYTGNSGTTILQLFNEAGNLVKQLQLNQSAAQIVLPLTNLAPGHYFLVVTSGNQKSTSALQVLK